MILLETHYVKVDACPLGILTSTRGGRGGGGGGGSALTPSFSQTQASVRISFALDSTLATVRTKAPE